MLCVVFVEFMSSGVGLLSVAAQLAKNGEPGDDGNATTQSRVRCYLINNKN